MLTLLYFRILIISDIGFDGIVLWQRRHLMACSFAGMRQPQKGETALRDEMRSTTIAPVGALAL